MGLEKWPWMNSDKKSMWIVNSKRIVWHLIHKCVICRKLRGKMGYQRMEDLLLERCTEAAAFTYCGVDLFGPLIIKEKRSELKRYGAPFTCVSSRAVHIEVTNSLYTESFILALCRFMARRGAVCSIWSDNGTNFVVARNKLQPALLWILWHNNPPGASHMWRVWECQIRSAKTILEGLLKTGSHSLNVESLRKLMGEVEHTINSRPLTVETISDSWSTTFTK